jgi:hypothetical protein
MTTNEPRRPTPEGCLRDFPGIGDRMRAAYLNLWLAGAPREEGQSQPPGVADGLPRPWDLATCHEPQLRREVWQWLDKVVDWINTEYAWVVDGMIPACWYEHPHVVHDLGTLADQRLRAAAALNSDDLEAWQQYCLPSFVERMRTRLGPGWDHDHKEAPGRTRILRYRATESVRARRAWFDTEVKERAAG